MDRIKKKKEQTYRNWGGEYIKKKRNQCWYATKKQRDHKEEEKPKMIN